MAMHASNKSQTGTLNGNTPRLTDVLQKPSPLFLCTCVLNLCVKDFLGLSGCELICEYQRNFVADKPVQEELHELALIIGEKVGYFYFFHARNKLLLTLVFGASLRR